MRVRDYSTSVLELIQSGMSPETVLASLKTVLASRGHGRLYSKILRELETRVARDHSRTKATLTVAKKDDVSAFQHDIGVALSALGVKEYETVVDTTITGGFIVEAHEKRIDQSHKKTLLTLYRSLIKS